MALLALPGRGLLKTDQLFGSMRWTFLCRAVCGNPLPSDVVSSDGTEMSTASFETLYNTLSRKLSTLKYVKATDVNRLFYSCNSLEQLQQAKDILAQFRKSPSHYRYSQAMVIIRTCLKLGVPEEALQIAMDPVKYGMFPFKKGIHTLLLAFTERQDTEGVRQVIRLMTQREIKPTGLQHYLMSKTSFLNLIDLKSTEKEKTEGGGNNEGPEGTKGELTLENLESTLAMCMECLEVSVDYGSRACYFINGKLLSLGMHQLSSQMLDKLETEERLPRNVLMNMRVDTLLAAGDLAGVLTVLQKMQGRNDQLPKRRLPRLLETFSSCEDKNLQQSFQELKLLS